MKAVGDSACALVLILCATPMRSIVYLQLAFCASCSGRFFGLISMKVCEPNSLMTQRTTRKPYGCKDFHRGAVQSEPLSPLGPTGRRKVHRWRVPKLRPRRASRMVNGRKVVSGVKLVGCHGSQVVYVCHIRARECGITSLRVDGSRDFHRGAAQSEPLRPFKTPLWPTGRRDSKVHRWRVPNVDWGPMGRVRRPSRHHRKETRPGTS